MRKTFFGGLLRKCPQGEQKSVISASQPSAGMWKVYVLDPGPYFHIERMTYQCGCKQIQGH